MTGTVLTAAALSAVFHAWWNILARQHDRPTECLAAMAVATASLCLVILPLCGLPRFEAWPWLAAASITNILYLRMLGRAYAQHDFCAVYGIIRATVPAILFLVGALYLGEKTEWAGQLGLAIVTASILIFAIAGGAAYRLGYKTIARSTSVGLILASVIFLDVQGIRASGNSFMDVVAYAAASSLLTAAGILAVTAVNGGNVISFLMNNAARCYAGATLLLVAYLLGMWAYAQGPIGLVAPIRESSILVAGALAVFILRDKVTYGQWAAMVLATVGIVLVQSG
jgi:drug/metabolite transporter (DMT)-like permease